MRTPAVAATAVICLGLVSGSGGAGSSGTAVRAEVAAASTDVSFVVDGTTTYGTLEVPAHRADQHLAAALLLAGSGPTDRNGNQEPDVVPNTLRRIADALAGMGIISLRFDKYFTGRTGAGRFAADPASADLNASIRQADAGYTFLSKQPATDQKRLLAVG